MAFFAATLVLIPDVSFFPSVAVSAFGETDVANLPPPRRCCHWLGSAATDDLDEVSTQFDIDIHVLPKELVSTLLFFT